MKLLHLDIEVAPSTVHAWGLFNVNVGINQIMESSYTLCYAAKWHGSKEILFDSIYINKPEKMLAKLHALIDEADAICTYNGKNFDMKILHKDFLLYDLPPPAPYKNIDLLQVMRKKFKFVSNKLDFISQALNLGKKEKHQGHQLWIDCMNNDPKAWSIMEKYNKQDVKLLEKLYVKILPWISAHPNRNLYDGTEHNCPNCGSNKLQRRGTSHALAGSYQRWQCQGCGSWSQTSKAVSTVKIKPCP